VPTTIPSPDGGPRETVLRFCFTHPRTTLGDVRAVLDTLR
jgi:hypothetical protein